MADDPMDKLQRLAAMMAAMLALAAMAGPAHAADDPLQRIKKLEGTWVAVDGKGRVTDQVVSVFHVTANGHSVQEVMFPGTDHEMVNMYFRDVDDVLVTHYCAGGNQPTLRLVPSTRPGVMQLEFINISNMITMNDEHMHEAQYQWLGEDRLKTEWRTFRNGRFLDATRIEMVRRR
jgi:hypothetical protein